jgi:predicted dehydrogenase
MTSHTAAIVGIGPHSPSRGGGTAVAYAHAWALRKAGIPIVAAAARSQANRDGFASEFPDTRLFADYQAMLAATRPTLVSICAFPQDREAMALAALEHGARLLWIEKPVATEAAAARRIATAAARAGARVVVNFQRRYGAPFAWFRETVTGGRIGALQGIDVVQPGDTLMNFGPHLIDAALSALGGRKPVASLGAVDRSSGLTYQGNPTEDHHWSVTHFADGVRLTITSGNLTSRSPILRAHGDDGFAELHCGVPTGAASVFRWQGRGSAGVENPPCDEHFHHGTSDGNLYYDRLLVDVLACEHAGRSCIVDLEHGIRGLEIIEMAERSAREGRLVRWPD